MTGMIGLQRLVLLGAAAWLGSALAAGPARGTPKEPPDQPKPTEDVVRQGRINVVRSVRGTPEAQLTDDEGKRWLVIGALRKELRRLGGHQVKAWGIAGEKKVVLPTFSVRRYEITDSGGGKRPAVGKLRYGPSRTLELLLADRSVLKIAAKRPLRRRLKRRIGCKIWISGEVEGEIIKAFKFGWLRCSKAAPIKPRKETRR